MLKRIIALACCLGCSLATSPSVILDNATVTGITQGSIHKFLGIPYAAPPVGRARYRQAEALPPHKLPINATAYGPSCPQHKISSPFGGLSLNITDTFRSQLNFKNAAGPEDEDCLTINVIRPSFITSSDSFPVVVWIYGGGFQVGNSAEFDGDAVRVVNRSVELGMPIIFVSINYRLSAYGFLGGREVYLEGIGNLGLIDQRIGLRWIQRYIQQFGGNKTQVMLWGQSSGAISIAMQMLSHGGTAAGIFHSAFMQSGSVIPVGSALDVQVYYDFIVNETGCSSAVDTLGCLRQISFPVLKAAIDKTPSVFSYESLVQAFVPRTDGFFFTQNPQIQVQEGRVAQLPIVVGSCDDEGTVFALSSRNITTEVDFRQYVSEVWFPGASARELDPLWSYYSSNLADGSPFDTGDANAITPQFKRMAAFQGDAIFNAPRRLFTQSISGKQKIWVYSNKKLKSTPVLGSFQGSDLYSHLMDDYVINFAVNQDPNNATGIHWPEYTKESPQSYTFGETGAPTITLDNFREEEFQYLTNLSLVHPL